jgi:hypothetical protein
MTEHQSFAEKSEKRGIRIWAFGIVVYILVSLLAGHFQWNAILIPGCALVVGLIMNRFATRQTASFRIERDNLTSINKPGVLFYEKLNFLVRNFIAIWLLFVSFWPLLNVFYLLRGQL